MGGDEVKLKGEVSVGELEVELEVELDVDLALAKRGTTETVSRSVRRQLFRENKVSRCSSVK